jgi:hypothetical protein
MVVMWSSNSSSETFFPARKAGDEPRKVVVAGMQASTDFLAKKKT